MLEEKREIEESNSGCKVLILIVYIGFGVLASPFMFFMFVMAHDAPQRNSLQTGTEIFYFFLIALYIWGFVKLAGTGSDKSPDWRNKNYN